MPQALVQILLGEEVDIRPRHQHGACYKFFSPPPGIFRRAIGVEEAGKLPGILDFGLNVKPGTLIGAVADDTERHGFVVSTGLTRAEAIANADHAIASIRYETDPSTPPETTKA